MATEQKLFDLFGDFTARWPSAIQRLVGVLGPGSEDPDLAAWLAALNSGTQIKNTRTGAAGGRLSVEAQLNFDNAQAAYAGKPDGFPFALNSMPDVEFRIQTLLGPKFMQLFVSVSATGTELVIEGLPVEILLPAGLIQPPGADDADVTTGSFTPGSLDALKIVYRRIQPTSIFVHIRLHMTEDNEFVIRPSVPISFGKCLFSEAPVKALHNFQLIPSPTLARRNEEWLRHTIEPWVPEVMLGPLDGLFSIRSIDLDEQEPPFKDIADALNSHGGSEPEAEFVLDDVVVPFFSPYVIPIPRHITIGIRRRILQDDSIAEVFAFDQAPAQIFLNRDESFGLLINSLFYKSLPSEDLSEDLGLTFSAVIFFGENGSEQHGFEISLAENYTPLLGYRRGFSSSTGLPEPGTGAAATINALLHWEIATIVIDIMGFRGGYSLGRAIGEGKGFGDCFEFTADLFVSMPPTGGDDAFFRMRSLDGQKIKFAIEGIGWKQGSFQFKGLALPDGVAVFLGPVKIIIEEFGLVAETGAAYLSFSGGLGVDLPSGFAGSMVFKRLRFRISGNPTAPPFKLDGFFIALQFAATLRIEAGGFYSEKQIADATLREFGLTGTVAFEIHGAAYLFALDVLAGSLRSPAESFDYFMFQIVFRGTVPIAWFELRGVRALFARNMQPKLSAANNEAYELRYYNWYKTTNPVNVTGDRRLAAWQPQKDSWALGVGLSASIAQIGRIIELTAFVLVVSGNDENGFLIVAEALLLQNPSPIAFIAIQWDGKNDQFSMLIGVNITPRMFVRSVPAWVDRIAKLTGTLFICNKPVVVALGRLADTRTWFSLTFDFNVWAKIFIQFGICFEYSEAPGGGQGFGFIVRLEGTINGGIVKVNFNAGFGGVFAVFKTASNDYAAAFWIEAGLRIVLFRFLRFGISARAEFRNVGATPSRGELRAEIRLETPWFLPDVTWTFDATFGTLEPAGLATATSALRAAMAVDAARQKGQVVHIERIDPTWNGEGAARTWSINELRGMALDEAGRLARFAANTEAKPIATDSCLSIDFSVAVNDNIGIGGAAPGLGNQNAGVLALNYDLIGLAIRRRARFGADRNWHTLQEQIELTADFSDPNGVDLSGTFSPSQLTLFWSPDTQIQGQTASKKLLINSRTPYDFQTKNQETDEETVKDNPVWPCCGRGGKQPYRVHEVTFRTDLAGTDISGYRLYSQSQSRFRFIQNAYAWGVTFGSVLPPGTIVALVLRSITGVVFRADLDEDAAVCYLRLFWNNSFLRLDVLAFDGTGKRVGLLGVTPKPDFQDVVIPLTGPARRLEARIVGSKDGAGQPAPLSTNASAQGAAFALDRAGYVGLRDYLDYLFGIEACGNGTDEFETAYSGRGALAFLPNHEYEFALTTRITVTHPSKPAESVEIKEFTYFRTKGLPGLNAVETVGDEVAPYVASAYEGGRGTLYREEPVAVVFNEDFHVAVPIPLRPPGTAEERNSLLVMKLVVRPDLAPTLATPFTTTAADWIVDHRGVFVVDPLPPFKDIFSTGIIAGTVMRSTNTFRNRLAAVTQRPGAQCPLPDPREVVGTALIALPQGEPDPLDPAKQLWPVNLPFTAAVKLDGAGFVDRPSFVEEDLTAFQFALDGGLGGSTAWSVADGAIRTSAGAARRFALFGEADWNYLISETTIPAIGSMAGIGVALPAAGAPNRGLFAVVQPSGDGRRLVVFRRLAGNQFVELASAPLPAAADPAAPVLLSVTTFDDKLRATVGETTIEVDREELREGRLCLLAQGACRFSALRVRGLDIYRFPFQTSRYRSFTDHIGSFEGPPDIIDPDALGPGTTTTTTGALLSATSAAIGAAMEPEADPALRQTLFERWVSELGLPLKDEVNQLEISRFLDGGKTQFFLLESPEALDFTEEIRFALSRRDRVIHPPPVVGGTTGTKTDKLARRKAQAREDLGFVIGAPVKTASKNALVDVTKQDGVLEIVVDTAALPDRTTPLLVVEAAAKGGERRLVVYAVPALPAKAKGQVRLRAEKTDEIIPDLRRSPLVSAELAALQAGTFALVTRDLRKILGLFGVTFVWTPLTTVILQDSTGKRALIVPGGSGVAKPLAAGTYRLKFDLNRQRWQTTDPPDELNQYSRSVTLQFVF